MANIICSISKEETESLYQLVFGDFYDALTNKESINIETYMRDVLDLVKGDTEDDLVTEAYAQILPGIIMQAASIDSNVLGHLATNPNFFSYVATKLNDFKDFEKVQEYLGTGQKSQDDAEQAANAALAATKNGALPPDEKGELVTQFNYLIDTMFATGGFQNLINATTKMEDHIPNPDKAFYYNFIKFALDNASSDNEFEFHLTAMPLKAIRKMDPKNEKGFIYNLGARDFISKDDTLILTITDRNGKILLFDKNYKQTQAGKPIFFPARSGEQTRKKVGTKILSPEKIAKRENITVEEATEVQNKQFDFMSNLKKYTDANINLPDKWITMPINGASLGALYIDYNIATPISQIDFGGVAFRPQILIEENEDAPTKSFAVFKMPGYKGYIPIIARGVPAEIADKLAKLLVEDIYVINPNTGKETKLTFSQKVKLMKNFIYENQSGIAFTKNAISLSGKKLDLKNKEQAIKDIFTHLHETYYPSSTQVTKAEIENGFLENKTIVDKADENYKDKFGENTVFKNGSKYFKVYQRRLHIDKDVLKKTDRMFNNFGLEKIGDKLYLKNNEIDYRQFIKDNFFINFPLNSKNQLVGLNGYFKFNPSSKDFEKIINYDAKKKTESKKKAKEEKKAKEKETPKAKEIAKPTATNVVKSILANQRFRGLSRNQRQAKQFAAEYGISFDLTQLTPEQINQKLEEARQWFENSPFSKVFDFENLLDQVNTSEPSTIAKFVDNMIILWSGADYSDLYHEAWHGFTRMFMTEAQRNELYERTAKRSGTFRTYQGITRRFDKASKLELEEFLAEEFRAYMLSGGKMKIEDVKQRNIFKKIYDFLMELFGAQRYEDMVANQDSLEYVRGLYDNLKLGDLTGYTFSEENLPADFKILNKGIEASNPKTNVPTLNTRNSLALVDVIDSLLSDFINEYVGIDDASNGLDGNNTFFTTSLIGFLEGREEAFEYAKQKIEERIEYLDERIENEPSQIKKDKLIRQQDTLQWAIDNWEGKDGKGVLNYYNKKSKFIEFGKKYDKIVTIFEDINDPKAAASLSNFERKGNESSLTELASEKVLYLIRSIHAVTSDNEFVENDLGFKSLMDFNLAWNRLARTLQGSNSVQEMYKRLYDQVEDYPFFAELLLKLGNPDTQMDPNSQNMWTSFFQSFSLSRVPLIAMVVNEVTEYEKNEDGKKIATGYSFEAKVGGASVADKKIGRDWNDHFKTTEETQFIKKNANGVNYLDIPAVLEAYRGQGKNINRIKFFQDIGINFENKSKIVQALNAMVPNPAVTILNRLQDINDYNEKEIAKAEAKNRAPKLYEIKSIGNMINEIEKFDLPSLATDYNKLQSIQARFSDDYSDFMVVNAAGDTQFEFMLNSSLSQMIRSINSARDYNTLISQPHMNHLDSLRNPFVSIDPRSSRKRLVSIYELFDMSEPNGPKRSLKEEYGGTDTVSIDISNMAGVAFTVNDESNNGIAAADADEVSKRIADFHVSVMYGLPMGTTPADKSTILLYHLSNRKYYVSPENFISQTNGDTGKSLAYDILLGYLEAELDRINIVSNLPEGSPELMVPVGKSTYGVTGKEFVIFQDMLSKETKEKLKSIPDEFKSNLRDYLDTPEGRKLNQEIYKDVIETYFVNKTNEFKRALEKAEYTDKNIIRRMRELSGNKNLKKEVARNAAIRAHVFNSFIHNVETVLMYHGDPALYNMAKEEFHKRNAGINSTGVIPRVDNAMLDFINDVAFGLKEDGEPKARYSNSKWYNGEAVNREYGSTMRSAVFEDVETKSLYFDLIKKGIEESIMQSPGYKKGNISSAQFKSLVDERMKAYAKMTEGDGQGWLTFDGYKALSIMMDAWSEQQETLYRKILNKEYVSQGTIVDFFPVLKMQYWGPLQTEGLPLMAFHKFSLMPLIPSTIEGTDLEDMHNLLTEQGFDYALFGSGSKVSTLTPNGTPDKFYDNPEDIKNRRLAFTEEGYKLTPNDIFLQYFKKQVEMAPNYKGKVTFSTQLRKLVESGLMEAGVPTDYNAGESLERRRQSWAKLTPEQREKASKKYTLLKRFENNLQNLMDQKKQELLDEMGWSYDSEGKPTGPMDKLFAFIEKQLTKQDLADHHLDFIDVTKDGKLKHSLDTSLAAAQIEKVLVSIVNKRLIKQKIKGEALVQVSGTGFTNRAFFDKFKNLPLDERLKVLGSNDLPFYTPGNAMKVKVALQGDFLQLLKLPEVNDLVRENLMNGEPMTHLEALNKLIKDEEWLNKDNNRRLISMAGVRIPVQSLNSMEAMEVYEFLPEGGHAIVLPVEIVAKSGGDFDIDKLTIMMPSIEVNDQGDVVLKETYENNVLQDIMDIVLLPENYADLITPNGTDIVLPLAKELAKKVRPYNSLQNVFADENGETIGSVISGTRLFEIEYNIYKHGSNSIGKRTLGQGAVDNTYNVILNTVGAYLEPEYEAGRDKNKYKREQKLMLTHNTLDTPNGKAISLSHIYDADGVYKISDVISQLINGWVDIAKDPWIFDIQGNNFVAPSLLLMIQAGVPIREAVYFVSQPVIREYIEGVKKAKSAFAKPLGIELSNPNFFRNEARKQMLENFSQMEDYYKVDKRGNKYIPPKNLYAATVEYAESNPDIFNLKELENNVSSKVDYSDTDLGLLLHFFDIEDMSKVITAVKRTTNFDTATASSLFQSSYRQANADILAEDGRLGQDIVKKILTESPIASFGVTDFMRDLYKDIFEVRDSETMNKYLLSRLKYGIQADVEKTFGDVDEFISNFRNDFVMFMFQNYIRNFDIDALRSYRSFAVEKYSTPIEPTSNSPLSAFVKVSMVKGKPKPVMFFDKEKLAEEFEMMKNGADPYEDLGFELGAVNSRMFQNVREYARFVMEREYLRFVIKPQDIVNTDMFNEYYTEFFDNTDMEEDENAKEFDLRAQVFAYETTLRNMALENTFNHFYMFKSKFSVANKLEDIKNKYPELAENFKVLDFLVKDKTTSNESTIKFKTSKLDTDRINKFYEDMQDLSDVSKLREVLQVNEAELESIAKFFSNLPIYTMFTTGFNSKGANGIGQVMPNDRITAILENMLNYVKKEKIFSHDLLKNYYKQFVKVNSVENSANRFRLKNYTLAQPMWKASKSAAADVSGQVNDIVVAKDNYGNNSYYSDFAQRPVVEGEDKHNVVEDADELLKMRKNFLFVVNGALDAKAKPLAANSDSVLLLAPSENTFALTSRKNYLNSVSARLSDSTYDDNIKAIEKSIQELKEAAKDYNGKIFWNGNGYGQYMIGADNSGENIDPTKAVAPETFVYLSKRLWEEFGYKNKNYESIPEGKSFVKVTAKDIIKKLKECLS